MKSVKVLFYIRHLSWSSTQQFFHINSFQQRCFLHTCLPLMNQEKSSDKSDGSQEQPHMRIEAKAAAKGKGIYTYTFSNYLIIFLKYYRSK